MDRTAAAARPGVLAAARIETRREHLLGLRTYLGMEPFSLAHYRQTVHATTALAVQTDGDIVLASSVLGTLRRRHVILPTLDVVERAVLRRPPAPTGASTMRLAESLSDAHAATGLEAHQLDRRLPLAQRRQDRGGQAQAAAIGSAYDFFVF